MKVTPIIFSAPMVRALLEGRKSQTRRIIKPQPQPNLEGWDWGWKAPRKTVIGNNLWRDDVSPRLELYCPYGKAGDLLYVRENVWLPREASLRELREGADTWQPDYYADGLTPIDIEQYREWGWKPTPSIHMPRHVSRIVLDIAEVRVQRLQDISEADAIAEGPTSKPKCHGFGDCADGWSMDWPAQEPRRGWRDICLGSARSAYGAFMNQLHGGPLWNCKPEQPIWDQNPWVWCISFFVHQVNIDAFLKAPGAAA